jgi:hypothetical protein
VYSPVLYKIQGQKRSSVIHHDKLKPCNDRNIPLWVNRIRNEVLANDEEDEGQMVEEKNLLYGDNTQDLGLINLFNAGSQDNSKLVKSKNLHDNNESTTLAKHSNTENVPATTNLRTTRTGRQIVPPAYLKEYNT